MCVMHDAREAHTRPTVGSNVIVQSTKHTREALPAIIGDRGTITVDDTNSSMPYGVSLGSERVWLCEGDVRHNEATRLCLQACMQ